MTFYQKSAVKWEPLVPKRKLSGTKRLEKLWRTGKPC